MWKCWRTRYLHVPFKIVSFTYLHVNLIQLKTETSHTEIVRCVRVHTKVTYIFPAKLAIFGNSRIVRFVHIHINHAQLCACCERGPSCQAIYSRDIAHHRTSGWAASANYFSVLRSFAHSDASKNFFFFLARIERCNVDVRNWTPHK